MIYDAQKHRKFFERGVDAAVAAACPRTPGFLRRRVTRATINNLPSVHYLAVYGPETAFRRITESRKFRDEVGSIWMLLLPILVEAIVRAVLAYWFGTKATEGQAEL